jgi:hypothetical protein
MIIQGHFYKYFCVKFKIGKRIMDSYTIEIIGMYQATVVPLQYYRLLHQNLVVMVFNEMEGIDANQYLSKPL